MDEFLYAFKKKKKVNPSCYWLATSNSGNITLDHMQVLMKKQGALQLVGYEHPTSTWTRGLLLTIDTMGVKQAKKCYSFTKSGYASRMPGQIGATLME